jgi:uncharacterized protein YecA (UPF0149 family)
MIGENEERGYFCKSGTNKNLFVIMRPGDNDILRPIVDIYDMADKMEYIYLHQDEAKEKAERAYKEIWTWKQVGEQWKQIFVKAENLLKVLRAETKIGRNEPCPCLSGKKYKDCHGA